jgi:hypothetical protein
MAVSTIDALYNGTSEKLTTSATGITVTGTAVMAGLTLGANNANSPQILFENSDGVTGDAALSTYDDTSGTMLVMGSNFYINSSGSESRFNTSEESSAVMLNRNGDLNLLTGGTGATATTRLKIDSSGNLLVGKSVQSISTDGVTIVNGQITATSDGADAIRLNRKTSDGSIIDLRKDGTTIGSIDTSGGNLIVQGSTSAGKTGIKFGGSQWIPQDNGNSDGGVDLGMLSARFNDIYATNGTIQTSDRNEKQDITSLTATEMLVGKRISALFKTFRWKDSVAEKGDNARTHTGVIAQDVQAAFTAEGLDAGNYALFISSTWWEHDVDVPAVEAVAEVTDEDGNVITEAVEAVDAYTRTDTYDTEDEAPEGATSKTRMGIRYPELLSFVAAYNEQRFASIEARLTALEAYTCL